MKKHSQTAINSILIVISVLMGGQSIHGQTITLIEEPTEEQMAPARLNQMYQLGRNSFGKNESEFRRMFDACR